MAFLSFTISCFSLVCSSCAFCRSRPISGALRRIVAGGEVGGQGVDAALEGVGERLVAV